MPSLIPGVELDFGGGRVYTVPPLSLGALQQLQGKLESLQDQHNPLSPAAVSTVLQATHSALVRNYPAITPDDVANLVDVGNMHEVIAAVLDVAGIKRKAQADAKNPTAQPDPAPLTGPG